MKYQLVKEDFVVCEGKPLFRIMACKEIRPCNGDIVPPGELGGYVESEENLSQFGDAWIYDDACVFDAARVSDSAIVAGDAKVHGRAQVCECAVVSGKAEVLGSARVCDCAFVGGHSSVGGTSLVSGSARIGGFAVVLGDAWVHDDNALLTVFPIGPENDRATFFNGKDGKIYVDFGPFYGDIDEFVDDVNAACKTSAAFAKGKHAKAYLAAAELAKIQIETKTIQETAERS